MNTVQANREQVSTLTKVARAIFLLLALLFILAILFQVFLAGAGALVDPSYWVQHRAFAHLIEFFPILMLVVGLFARLPRKIHLINLLLFVLFVLQYVFLYVMPAIGLPALRGLHAVNALALFSFAWYVGLRAWPLVRLS